MTSRTYLIAGCGYVGCELARQLVDAGHRVIALRRHPDAAATELPDEVTWIAADLTDATTLANLPAVDGVAYAVAPTERSDAAYDAAYVVGLRNLLHALPRERLRRFVLTSSTGVYAQQDGGDVTEDSPAEPDTAANRAIIAGERLLLDTLPAGVAVVLRLAGMYGPGRLVPRLVRQVVDGTIAYGDAAAPSFLNLIHRDDAAGALAHLLTMAADPPPVLIGVDHEPAERRALFAFIAERLQIPLPPPFPGQAPPRGRNKRCRNDRLLATGYVFRHPTFRSGMRDLIVDPDDSTAL